MCYLKDLHKLNNTFNYNNFRYMWAAKHAFKSVTQFELFF